MKCFAREAGLSVSSRYISRSRKHNKPFVKWFVQIKHNRRVIIESIFEEQLSDDFGYTIATLLAIAIGPDKNETILRFALKGGYESAFVSAIGREILDSLRAYGRYAYAY